MSRIDLVVTLPMQPLCSIMGNFRELRVWKRAQNLALDVYRSTSVFPKEERWNIAEGWAGKAIESSPAPDSILPVAGSVPPTPDS